MDPGETCRVGGVVLRIREEEGRKGADTVFGMYCLEENNTNKQTYTQTSNLLSLRLSISGFCVTTGIEAERDNCKVIQN